MFLQCFSVKMQKSLMKLKKPPQRNFFGEKTWIWETEKFIQGCPAKIKRLYHNKWNDILVLDVIRELLVGAISNKSQEIDAQRIDRFVEAFVGALQWFSVDIWGLVTQIT